MSKYQFILMSKECDAFVERLRSLGMVDITTTGWQPSEQDRQLTVEIEAHEKAIQYLETFIEEPIDDTHFNEYALPFYSGAEAFAHYAETMVAVGELDAKIAEIEKLKEEAEPWGDFSSEMLGKINDEGLKLNYFVAIESAYEAIVAERGEELLIEPINICEGRVYFVVVTREGDGANVDIDAQMVRPLRYSVKEADAQIAAIESDKLALSPEISRAAVSIEKIIENRLALIKKLQFNKVTSMAEHAADGSLMVLEGWAEESTSIQVDSMLNSMSGVVSLKSTPTPEDDTPVKLQNGSFSRIFEMVGNLYALPKYGTIDLTPFFAPFYMMFFAICLCDAGYGAMILLTGLLLFLKGGESMRAAAKLSLVCGGAAVAFGFYANSFFGLSISSWSIFEHFPFLDFQKSFFTVSMIIGMVQILLGMVINIFVKARSFGFKYALGSLGWFMIIFSSVLSGALTACDITSFGFDSVPYYTVAGLGGFLMLFFNSPGENIFVNLGAGIWGVYDGVTGLLGDVLSYIRLFAIGLSGGVLALVFNDLAMGMTGLSDGISGQPIGSVIMKILGATAILLIGHGLSLFMSTISSFVHPMRLTFVEFYKNAGFEMGVRKFTPIK